MASAANILQRQFKELTRNPVPGFVVDLKEDNIFEWEVALIGSPKTIYEGGYFKLYPDGRLCISILHPPGEDPVSGEKAEERWNPTQGSVLVSIISLLADPNCSSPANVDAGVAYRKNRALFDSIVKSKKDIGTLSYILILFNRASRRI
ncbi:ubiquitin-conjugating enzyme [Backusella circina FSU 941]|nr:ubiquitin-conjugating enzyme [Backusella circina FSU 941]